jgi:arylsulfatase
MRSQPGKFTLSGDGLRIRRDSGDAVSEEYKSPGEFKGGTILFVAVTVERGQYLDLEKLATTGLRNRLAEDVRLSTLSAFNFRNVMSA